VGNTTGEEEGGSFFDSMPNVSSWQGSRDVRRGGKEAMGRLDDINGWSL
jgi:hypothetical protein